MPVSGAQLVPTDGTDMCTIVEAMVHTTALTMVKTTVITRLGHPAGHQLGKRHLSGRWATNGIRVYQLDRKCFQLTSMRFTTATESAEACDKIKNILKICHKYPNRDRRGGTRYQNGWPRLSGRPPPVVIRVLYICY